MFLFCGSYDKVLHRAQDIFSVWACGVLSTKNLILPTGFTCDITIMAFHNKIHIFWYFPDNLANIVHLSTLFPFATIQERQPLNVIGFSNNKASFLR